MSYKTLIVFHRCGGKSLNYPPNTILTAKWATEYGAKAIEYDVVVCNDDGVYKIVVIEPKLLKQEGLDINNLQFNDVEKINTGNSKFGSCKVALVDEMIETIDDAKTGHQIHIKGDRPEILKILLPKLQNLKNFLVTSFDVSVIKELKILSRFTPAGWIVKSKQETGNEGLEDLTAEARLQADRMPVYSKQELEDILKQAKGNMADVVILCGPRIHGVELIEKVKKQGLQVGAWGVGTNLNLAKRLIKFGIDRLTLDNPEQLFEKKYENFS